MERRISQKLQQDFQDFRISRIISGIRFWALGFRSALKKSPITTSLAREMFVKSTTLDCRSFSASLRRSGYAKAGQETLNRLNRLPCLNHINHKPPRPEQKSLNQRTCRIIKASPFSKLYTLNSKLIPIQFLPGHFILIAFLPHRFLRAVGNQSGRVGKRLAKLQ